MRQLRRRVYLESQLTSYLLPGAHRHIHSYYPAYRISTNVVNFDTRWRLVLLRKNLRKVRSIATTYVVARRSKLSIATTSVVAIKRKLSIATIRLYFLSDLSYRGNNTNFVYCHDMGFRTKFHRRCLGKLLNRVKLHVHHPRIIFLVNYPVKLNLCCNLQIKNYLSTENRTASNAILSHGGIHRWPFRYLCYNISLKNLTYITYKPNLT